jgi:tRNA (guanine37-N1)-methyltransferase
MQAGIVTLFPGMFSALSEYGITGRALRQGLMQVQYWNPRDYATDRHRTVDDRPYGGGPGMLMKTGPVSEAIHAAKAALPAGAKVIYLSPQGKALTQDDVVKLASRDSLVLLCGRYEGVDERVLDTLVDEEFSLGDFVLSGGELAAMALLDAVIRLLPGALGHVGSAGADSFAEGLLDHPHYTRPEVFEGQEVPPVLLSGDHARIARWRLQQRLGATWLKRPDLLERLELSPEQRKLLDAYMNEYEGSKTGKQ